MEAHSLGSQTQSRVSTELYTQECSAPHALRQQIIGNHTNILPWGNDSTYGEYPYQAADLKRWDTFLFTEEEEYI